MIDTTRITRSLPGAILLFAGFAAALLPGCLLSRFNCQCVWEGPVSVDLLQARVADGALYVGGGVAWEPCCEPLVEEERSWRIDALTGESGRASLPGNATEVPVPGEGPLEVEFPDQGTVLSIEPFSTDSVLQETLSIGELRDAETGEVIRVIEVDVRSDS